MIKHLGLKAYGKINLGLDVVRRREDGYHEVRMIMQTVRVYDNIDLTRRTQPGIHLSTNLYYLPENENNLGYKAARLLMEGKTYTQVIEQTNISSATLSRVSRCVQYGQGYRKFVIPQNREG